MFETALPMLPVDLKAQAQVNLAATLVRLGRLQQALLLLEVLPQGESRGWALLHRANAHFYAGALNQSVQAAEAAFLEAKRFEDGFLAMSAKTVLGEALLQSAILEQAEPKDAAIALGQAIGIAEVLSEEASALTLAVLAHTHMVWGNQQKALEMAERAFKRARSAKDPTAIIRSLMALYAITKVGSFARNALKEAQTQIHQPLEQFAQKLVAEVEAKEVARAVRANELPTV